MPSSPCATEPQQPLSLWRVSDGRAGHDNQSLGLADALARLTPCTLAELPIAPRLGRWRAPPAPPGRPDLILAAGHRTHAGVIALRRAHGGRSVVLMQPTLPARWFDLCLVPAHDAPRQGSPHVAITAGALCRNRPAAKTAGSALVLVGGPSRHFLWDDEAVLAQVRAVVDAGRHARLRIADSPRTPPPLRSRLAALGVPYTGFDACPAGWLADTLASAEAAWVTRDSVSMIYEALSAGCRVGLIDVPPRRAGARLARASSERIEQGDVTTLQAWLAGAPLAASARPWAEADRCARLILERWFPGRLVAA